MENLSLLLTNPVLEPQPLSSNTNVALLHPYTSYRSNNHPVPVHHNTKPAPTTHHCKSFPSYYTKPTNHSIDTTQRPRPLVLISSASFSPLLVSNRHTICGLPILHPLSHDTIPYHTFTIQIKYHRSQTYCSLRLTTSLIHTYYVHTFYSYK